MPLCEHYLIPSLVRHTSAATHSSYVSAYCGAASGIGLQPSPEVRYNGEIYIRPLAKLSKAVKVADASNQGKTEGKALSSVTVTFREDTKPFEKTDGVFNKDTFS